MFRSLMTIMRKLYLYLTKVIFMLKPSVKLRRYINLVMWQHVLERRVCAVLSTAHNTHDILRHHPVIYNDVCFNINITLVRYR